jgi:hypothetical protein|tara:strand:+ start:339 stop:572 length:234 start_codon:yes stop_codon:yes gene_type:complete
MKYIVVIILLFDGELVKEKISYPLFISCSDAGQAHIETIASYKLGEHEGPPNFRFDAMRQGWYLHDQRGTVQGFYCD